MLWGQGPRVTWNYKYYYNPRYDTMQCDLADRYYVSAEYITSILSVSTQYHNPEHSNAKKVAIAEQQTLFLTILSAVFNYLYSLELG
jgi:hypothetical protein